ncbi:MAG: amino acid ABC transporter substrate-binding protein [Xanthobacteraceae bacterium]|nr:amino acid ABC transporter substrate-binding protein [Xanthobacteraceae bacterium]
MIVTTFTRRSPSAHAAWLPKWLGAIVLFACAVVDGGAGFAAEPIKIGLGIALSGQLAANGKAALVGMKIWEEDVNATGGLLGRPVKLVYYDDQSNPANVPGIYTKLLDIDKVDLIVSGYATNMIAPALVVAIQRNRLFLGLFGTAVNEEFHYPRYFFMNANGPDAKRAVSAGLFEVAAAQSPKPQTVAIIAAEAEFGRNAGEGARENAKTAGMTIVYDRTYPPPMTDLSPIVRAIAATNPDVLVICTYPVGTVSMLRAISEVGFTPKILGGAMVGLQSTAIKTQLGPLLNGVVNYESWLPTKTMMFAGAAEFLAKYQAHAGAEGVDPLGFNLPPFGYADLQVLQQAVEGAGSIVDAALAQYLHGNIVKTIIGDIQFGRTANGRSRACCKCNIATFTQATSPSSRIWTSR